MENKCCEKCLTEAWSNHWCANALCPCHSKAPETVEIAEYASGRKTANGIEIQAPTDEVEKLSATLHDIYQKEAHRQEAAGIGPARHYDEYEKLSEPVKEFDRVLARHIIELLQKEKEKGYSKGMFDATGGENAFDWRTRFVEQGKSEAFSLVRKMIEEKLKHYDKEGHEQLNKGNTMLAYDMDSRYVALKHLLSTLEGK